MYIVNYDLDNLINKNLETANKWVFFVTDKTNLQANVEYLFGLSFPWT